MLNRLGTDARDTEALGGELAQGTRSTASSDEVRRRADTRLEGRADWANAAGGIGPLSRRYARPGADGIAAFPNPVFLPTPCSFTQMTYEVVHYSRMPAGGHFASMEEPDLMLADLRAFVTMVAGTLA